MAEGLTLYYDPMSFFSKKVKWCLEEKKVSYNETIVSLPTQEYKQPWFMRINPKGEVPVLQHGEKIVSDSLHICQYIDKHFGAATMFPNEATQIGSLVKKYGDICRTVDIEMMTYAFMMQMKLQRDPEVTPQFCEIFKKSDKVQGNSIKLYEELAEQNPDLKDAYMRKIEILKKKINSLATPDDVEVGIQGTLSAMNAVEQQLKANVKAGHVDHWLCGPNFTYADVELGCLMDRLIYVGAGHRTWLDGKHHHLEQYFKKLEGRPLFKAVIRDVQFDKKR